MAASIYSGKVSGRTSATVDGTATGIIATKSIELFDDGSLRYTDASGFQRNVQLSGAVAQLFKEMFTGTDAPTAAWFV